MLGLSVARVELLQRAEPGDVVPGRDGGRADRAGPTDSGDDLVAALAQHRRGAERAAAARHDHVGVVGSLSSSTVVWASPIDGRPVTIRFTLAVPPDAGDRARHADAVRAALRAGEDVRGAAEAAALARLGDEDLVAASRPRDVEGCAGRSPAPLRWASSRPWASGRDGRLSRPWRPPARPPAPPLRRRARARSRAAAFLPPFRDSLSDGVQPPDRQHANDTPYSRPFPVGNRNFGLFYTRF